MTLTLSKLWNLALSALLTTILFAACITTSGHDPLGGTIKRSADAGKHAQASGNAIERGVQETGQALTTQAAEAQGLGKGIQDDVARGRSLTPPDAAGALSGVWDSLWIRAQGVLNVGAALNSLVTKVNGLSGEVHTLNGDVATLVDSNKTLVGAVNTANDRAAKAEKAAKLATTQAAHITALVVAFAIAAAGAGVFFALMLKDIKIGIAGIAGAVTIIVLASFLGQIDEAMHTLTHAAVIVAGVGGGLFLLEVLWRKLWEKRDWMDALLTAIKTNPLQDIQDVIADLKGAPAA